MKMDIHSAARDGDLCALQDAIRSGEDVNSVEVSWFVYVELKLWKSVFASCRAIINYRRIYNVAWFHAFSLVPKYCLSTSQMRGKVVGHHTAVFQATYNIMSEQTTSEPYCGDR